MRLGQLARKYGVSLNEILSYLQEIEPAANKLGRNSKLNDQQTAKVASHFENLDILQQGQEQQQPPQEQGQQLGQQQQEQQHTWPQQQEQGSEVSNSTIQQPTNPETEPSTNPETQQPINPETQQPINPPTGPTPVAIETDKLLEMMESEEKSPELDKFTLIKAPKKELEGLKVVGKIELPEPKTKKKVEPSTSDTDSDPKANKKSPRQRAAPSEEELEKRRLRAKKKKEQYEARQEKRRKTKEKEQRKAQNRARYQRKIEQAKLAQTKQNHKLSKINPLPEAEEVQEPPKTMLGRLWRWLTTY